jgi:hypothetical protein
MYINIYGLGLESQVLGLAGLGLGLGLDFADLANITVDSEVNITILAVGIASLFCL